MVGCESGGGYVIIWSAAMRKEAKYWVERKPVPVEWREELLYLQARCCCKRWLWKEVEKITQYFWVHRA